MWGYTDKASLNIREVSIKFTLVSDIKTCSKALKISLIIILRIQVNKYNSLSKVSISLFPDTYNKFLLYIGHIEFV